MTAIPELIGVADLRLDPENPRHPRVENDHEAIRILLDERGPEILRLAQDISSRGLNPTDVFLVLKEGPSYTVVEGNRRLAAIKLMRNPDIADEPRYRERFRKAAQGWTPIHDVWCAVVTHRDDAKYWQELRHTGERGGVGIVGWSAEAVARFHSAPEQRTNFALAFIDEVERSYPNNTRLQEALRRLRTARFTNLERVGGDPDARARIGLDIRDGKVVWHFDTATLEPLLERVVTDLAGPVPVGAIHSKQNRMQYLQELAPVLPAPSMRTARPRPLEPPAKPKRPARPPKPKPEAPPALLTGVRLDAFGLRIRSILSEIQELDATRFPNSAAVLLRVMLELSTADVARQKGWPDAELAKSVRRCLHEIDPTNKAPEFESVRRGLNDPNGMLAPQTLHKWVHNVHFNPAPADVRAWAANYAAFLNALNQLMPPPTP